MIYLTAYPESRPILTGAFSCLYCFPKVAKYSNELQMIALLILGPHVIPHAGFTRVGGIIRVPYAPPLRQLC